MKLIIFLIVLVHGCTCYAANWFPVGAIGAKKIYFGNKKQKNKCEKREKNLDGFQGCFDITGKNINYYVIGQVDNLNEPKYKKKNEIICVGQEQCQQKLESELDCSGLAEGTLHLINDEFTEVYCAEPNGYKKKPGLVEDPTLKAQYEAKKAEEQADKESKITKREARIQALVGCAKTKIADMSASVQKNCLRDIARELIKEKLKANEM